MHRLDEAVNAVLKLLSDKEWHRTEEIVEKAEINKDKTKEIAEFLNKFSFVEVRGENVRITSLGLKLLEL